MQLDQVQSCPDGRSCKAMMLCPQRSLLGFDDMWPAQLCWEKDGSLFICSPVFFLAIKSIFGRCAQSVICSFAYESAANVAQLFVELRLIAKKKVSKCIIIFPFCYGSKHNSFHNSFRGIYIVQRHTIYQHIPPRKRSQMAYSMCL